MTEHIREKKVSEKPFPEVLFTEPEIEAGFELISAVEDSGNIFNMDVEFAKNLISLKAKFGKVLVAINADHVSQ